MVGRVLNIKSEHLGISTNGSASYKAALALLSSLSDTEVFWISFPQAVLWVDECECKGQYGGRGCG